MNTRNKRHFPHYCSLAIVITITALAGCSPYTALRKNPGQKVHGYTAPEFSEVRRAFVENFRDRKELGAACAVYYKGEKVVDLWGDRKSVV